MPEYTVHFNTTTSVGITVDTDATDPEDILEEAWNEGIQTICAHCSGYGQNWYRDEGDDLEPQMTNGAPYITDENGNEYKPE